MSEEKKVKFSGDVSGLTSAFQKLREQAKQINKDLAADAAKYSDNTKEQIKYIEDEIRAIGRRNAAEKKSRQEAIRGTYDEKINSTNVPYLKDNLKKQKQSELLGVQREFGKSAEQTRLLKELLEETKKSARHQILTDKEKAAKESEAILADKTSVFSPEEKLKAGLIADQLKKGEDKSAKKKDKDESNTSAFMRALSGERAIRSLDTALGATVGATSREGVVKLGVNMAGGVIEAVTASLKALPIIGLLGGAAGVVAKQFGEGYERHIGEKNQYESSKFSLGALTSGGYEFKQKNIEAAQVVKKAKTPEELADEAYYNHRDNMDNGFDEAYYGEKQPKFLKGPNFRKGIIGGTIDELGSALGLTDSLSSSYDITGMSSDEVAKLQKRLDYQSAIDKGLKSKDETVKKTAEANQAKYQKELEESAKKRDWNSAQLMGVNAGQYYDSQKQILKGSGSAKNLGRRSLTQLALERGYGVDAGVMTSRTNMEMVSGGEANYTKIVATLEQLKKISPANNTALNKFIEAQTNFIGLSMKQNQKVNQDVASNRILSLDKLGGSFRFNDPRFMESVGKINDMITNPSNDFKQAASFSILRDTMGPNAGITDLLKAQQQGFGGANGGKLLQGWIDMSKRSGDKQSQVLALSSAGGFSIEEAEKLLNYQNQDFSKMKGADLNKILGRAEGFTTEFNKDSAAIADSFVKGATDGITRVAELFVTKIEQAIAGKGNKPKK